MAWDLPLSPLPPQFTWYSFERKLWSGLCLDNHGDEFRRGPDNRAVHKYPGGRFYPRFLLPVHSSFEKFGLISPANGYLADLGLFKNRVDRGFRSVRWFGIEMRWRESLFDGSWMFISLMSVHHLVESDIRKEWRGGWFL